MRLTPRQIAEQVRKMVAGEGVVFADLFAADGVLAYPFAPPGHPQELRGRDAIRDYFSRAGQSRELFLMEGVDAETWETGDPDVVITQITHHGQSSVTGGPYTFTALGVIRVRDGEIVRDDDYMDPIALARLLGRTRDLAAALATAAPGT
jgi:ketosteroid isomerase-like protein